MYEKLNKEPFFEEKISSIVQNIMVDIARCVAKKPTPFNKYSEKFNDIRNEIFNTVDDNWTLEKMAEKQPFSLSSHRMEKQTQKPSTHTTNHPKQETTP